MRQSAGGATVRAVHGVYTEWSCVRLPLVIGRFFQRNPQQNHLLYCDAQSGTTESDSKEGAEYAAVNDFGLRHRIGRHLCRGHCFQRSIQDSKTGR